MPEPRKVTIGCDCGLKLRASIPAGTKEGTRIQVTCRCGQKLRFKAPGTPKPSGDFEKWVAEMLRRSPYGLGGL